MSNKKEFEELQEALDSLTEEMIEALLEAGDDIIKALEETHKAERDPDGNPWKQRKKAYPWPINNKTGELLNSYKAVPNTNTKSISIQNTAAYAGYVDNVRKILPDGDIPVRFTKELQEALDDFIDEWNDR